MDTETPKGVKTAADVLPLTGRRRDYLDDLAASRDVDWASTVTMQWARDAGLTEPHGLGLPGRITDLGRTVLDINDKHDLQLSSKVLGRSPIKGFGSVYGSTGRCRCGERWQSNESPSKGGHRRIKAEHREHLRSLLASTPSVPRS